MATNSIRLIADIDPRKIADQAGAIPEELVPREVDHGLPDATLGHFPATGTSQTQLGLKPVKSRSLANPHKPEAKPDETPRSNLALCRDAVRRLDGAILSELSNMVQAEAVADPNTRNLMADSLRRVENLKNLIQDRNNMAEIVNARILAASKG